MIIEINCEDISTPKELHSLLADKLNFPNYYGKNWDAFWDVINEYYLPNKIILLHWSQLEKKLPRETKLLKSCLNEYNKLHFNTKKFSEIFYN